MKVDVQGVLCLALIFLAGMLRTRMWWLLQEFQDLLHLNIALLTLGHIHGEWRDALLLKSPL